jgi:hypothetical protein
MLEEGVNQVMFAKGKSGYLAWLADNPSLSNAETILSRLVKLERFSLDFDPHRKGEYIFLDSRIVVSLLGVQPGLRERSDLIQGMKRVHVAGSGSGTSTQG